MAGEPHFALPTILGQAVSLSCPNARCFSEATNSAIGVCTDVPEQIVRLDVVIAGVKVAVVLQWQGRCRRSARRCTDCAARASFPAPRRKSARTPYPRRDHPLIEDGDEEAAELLGADRPFRDEPAALGVQGPVQHRAAHPSPGWQAGGTPQWSAPRSG